MTGCGFIQAHAKNRDAIFMWNDTFIIGSRNTFAAQIRNWVLRFEVAPVANRNNGIEIEEGYLICFAGGCSMCKCDVLLNVGVAATQISSTTWNNFE